MRATKKRKRRKGMAKGVVLAFLLMALALCIIILPQIDLPDVRQRITTEASAQLKSEVLIARASLSLVPLPHFVLRGITIASAEWGSFAAEEALLYPRLLPLLKREVSIRGVFVKGPIVDLVVGDGIIEQGKDVFSYIDEKLLRKIPSLKVKRGMINLLRPEEKEPFFTARNLAGNISSANSGRVRIMLRFSCPWAREIGLKIKTAADGDAGSSCSVLARASSVDVEQVRSFILGFLGTNETVQTVFGIVRGGELSRITFQGQGHTLAEALDFEQNMRVGGAITNGSILTPPGLLPLEDVSGEFSIEQAMLHCRAADARLNKTTAVGVTLDVGLIAKREAFHLDGSIDADAGDLARYLPLIIDDKELRKEMASFKEVEGRGRGRLVLGEAINHIQPEVEVTSFRCSFRHASAPKKIFIEGGQFSLKNGKSAWKARAVKWDGLRWSNAQGTVAFEKRGIDIAIAKAELCGIRSHGRIYSHAGLITDSFHFLADKGDLASTLGCLWGKDAHIEGRYLLKAEMWAEGKKDPLKESSQGSLLFVSRNGRIYRWTLLSRLFGMLNVIGLFKGEFPDFTQKGFAYDHLVITGTLRDGYLYLDEFVVDGPALKIVGEGRIDVSKGELDITLLLAPLKTVDKVMSHIPLLGRIITGKSGTFISVPFSVTGPLGNPTVTPLSPSAVGSGLWGVLKRTLETPLELFKQITFQE